MSANNQIQAENVSSLSLREASEKAVSALEGLLDHGKNAPWQAWEKALNANTFLRQALVAAEVDRHDAPDDVEVIYLVWAFQGHGSWTDATKEQYEKAKHDDRMAVVSLDAYLSKEQRTRPQPQAVAQGWKDGDTAKLVNDLRDVAVQFHAAEQLRERIAHVIRPLTYRLSASPAAPAAAQVAQPLTEKEIEAGRGEVFSINNPFCPCDSKTFLKAVRWTERKHGIGKDHA